MGMFITDLTSVTIVGLDLAKHVFQVHGVDASGRVVVAKSIRRAKLLEFFASLYDPAEHWQAVRELKALQDCLGEFQDAEVQRDEIRAFAAQMLAERSAPAETLLAMGEIAAGLAVRQRAARARFDGAFANFASPASQARLAALARTSAA